MGGQHAAEEVGNEGYVVWQRSEVAAQAVQDETPMQSVSTGHPYHLQLQDIK